MNYFSGFILLFFIPITLAALKRNDEKIRPKPYPKFVFICPPGFVRLDMRTSCLRLFRPSRPANFDAASWACSVYPNGILAHMLNTDGIFAQTSVESENKVVNRFWVGIRRWATNRPLVYVGSNYSISEDEYRLQSLSEQSGNCVYYDTKKLKFGLADCRDDVSVDGFMCQSQYELLLLCNSTLIDRPPCCFRKFGSGRNETSCSRTVYMKGIKFDAGMSACAINRSCTVHREKSKLMNKTSAYCTAQCADDYSFSSKRYRCDRITFQSEENCQCPSYSKNSDNTEICFNDNPTKDKNTTNVVVIIILSLVIFFGIIGLIARRKFVKMSTVKRQTKFLETIVMD